MANAVAPVAPFVSSKRIRDSITLAYSTIHNTRNLEGLWYPPYTQTVSDVFNFDTLKGSLSAAERFYLSLSSELLVQLEILEGDSSEMEENDDAASQDGDMEQQLVDDDLDDHDVDEIAEADISIATNATSPDKKAHDNFPDVMLSHIETIARPMPDPNSGLHLDGWKRRLGARAFHRCFPLIGELKNAPPRGLQGQPYSDARDKLLSYAEDDLVVYLSMHFEGDPHASAVVGLLGVGGWWQWAEMRREDAVEYSSIADKESRKNSAGMTEGRYRLKHRFNGRPLVWLGTQQSDHQWALLRAKVVDILNFHHLQYPAAPTFD